MFICKYCNKDCTKRSHKNHELRCVLNINRTYKNGMLGKKGSNQYIKANTLGLEKPKYDTSVRPRSGCCAIDWHTKPEAKIASSKGGGYREKSGRSKKYSVLDSFGKQTTLQSSYEFRCSEILNDLGFKWLRPKALKYDGRNYFADFLLPEFGIWLDPKNTFKAKQDEDKIRKVIEQNNIKLFVLLEHQITKDYIRSLAEMD